MLTELVMLSNHFILCCPLLIFAFNLSQHQDLFQWVSSLNQVAKLWEVQLQHPSSEYSGLISFTINQVDCLAVPETLKNPPAPSFESINSLVLSLPFGPTLTSIHNYWKNHFFDCMDLCWQSDVSAF